MKNLAEKIKALVYLSKSVRQNVPDPIAFIKTKKAISKELTLSKQSGNALGVYSPTMGEGMFLTVVEHIDQDGIMKPKKNIFA